MVALLKPLPDSHTQLKIQGQSRHREDPIGSDHDPLPTAPLPSHSSSACSASSLLAEQSCSRLGAWTEAHRRPGTLAPLVLDCSGPFPDQLIRINAYQSPPARGSHLSPVGDTDSKPSPWSWLAGCYLPSLGPVRDGCLPNSVSPLCRRKIAVYRCVRAYTHTRTNMEQGQVGDKSSGPVGKWQGCHWLNCAFSELCVEVITPSVSEWSLVWKEGCLTWSKPR